MRSGLSEGEGKGILETAHQQRLFEHLARHTPGISAVVKGGDSTIVFANDAFCAHTGYSQAHHDTKYFSSYLDPAQRDRFFQHQRDVVSRPELGNRFVIYNLRDTVNTLSAFYLYLSVVPQEEAGREDLFYVFMIPDGSRWGTPFTSFDTRELFFELFKAEDFGTFEWNIESDKLYWSAGLYLVFEVERTVKDMNFSFMRQYIHPQERDGLMAEVKDALRTGGDINAEHRIVTARNNTKLLHCICRVIKDGSGRAVKLAGSIRDITNQRTIEQNMKKMVAELHRSNRELEEFAYAASHDLQEPLRKITTFSDRLSERYRDVLAGEGEMYLARMVSSAENMRQLINGLLEFSRISQAAGQYESVDLDMVMREVLSDLELKIEETGTIIRYDALPLVDGVRTQMKQLLQNLVSNAIKFQKEGVSPVISVELTQPTEAELQKLNAGQQRAYYKIVVADNGIGFENEYASRIFQVFQRLHGKSEYPGSGIGLAICKKILEYHHGLIYAESQPGIGSRFIFLLPLQQ